MAGKWCRPAIAGSPPEATLVGDVANGGHVRFEELAEIGYTDVIVRNLVPDQEAALATIVRLKEVKKLVG